jgi:alanine racemase
MDASNPHGALLTIDAAALVANWRLLAARAGPADCAAVVKADGYGLGIETVVPNLARSGCRTFFVAHLEEGVRARAAAGQAAIYVLNGMPPGSEGLYRAHDLRPVLGTIEEIGRWRQTGGGASALHVDTGMNRLGLAIGEAMALAGVNDWAAMGIDLLMTHLVSAEEADNPLNGLQADRFAAVAAAFGDRIARRSLANSSGHFLASLPRHELTRPGYALYGGNPTPGRPNPMQPVVRLEAPILQVRTIEAGEPVGYNAAWTAKRRSRIATLSIGYADGWLRSLSAPDGHAGAAALLDGVRCPLVGRVSMDLVTIDVTDAPDAQAGRRVTLIGDGIGVDDVAAAAGTNGYEILTSLGGRYQRQVIGV